jgi:hypothetical protein
MRRMPVPDNTEAESASQFNVKRQGLRDVMHALYSQHLAEALRGRACGQCVRRLGEHGALACQRLVRYNTHSPDVLHSDHRVRCTDGPNPLLSQASSFAKRWQPNWRYDHQL